MKKFELQGPDGKTYEVEAPDEGAALDARKTDAERALARAGGRLRKAVTARLGLRVAPELRFLYDDGQDARSRIDELLEEVKRDRRDQDA